jgi:hypothetical protein
MFPWGSKYLFGASAISWLSSLFYGLVTGGDFVGVVSYGYKGAVGDHLGYTVLVGLTLVTFMLGMVVFFTRDGDAAAMAALAGVESVPQVTPAARPAYWGPIAAFGAASLMVGLAVSRPFLYLGLATFFMVVILWTVQAWSDRVTVDSDINEVIRARTLGPLEVPMIATIGIAAVVLAMSRMFIAASHTGAVVIGVIFACLIFGGAVAMSRSDFSRKTWTAVLAVGAVAVLGGGIIGAALGERDFHEESPELHEGEGE